MLKSGLISIIVPVYKVEDYLPACLDSILASTYQDCELILVNDGSPDNCGKICDEYAAKDSRIKVIHQENQGVSAARNAGLKAATGEYIAFVDSDDVIHPRMFEVLHDAIISGEYDYSMVSGVIVQDEVPCYDDADENGTVEFGSRRIIGQEEYMSNLANLGYSAYQYHVVWNKLFRGNVINGLFFMNIAAEDVEWLSRFCLATRQGIFVEAELYYYIQRQGSLTHAGDELRIARINTYHTCLKNIPAQKSRCRAVMLKAIYSLIFACRHEHKNSLKLKDVNAIAKKIYHETRSELLGSNLSLARKCRIFFFYHLPCAFELVYFLRYELFR